MNHLIAGIEKYKLTKRLPIYFTCKKVQSSNSHKQWTTYYRYASKYLSSYLPHYFIILLTFNTISCWNLWRLDSNIEWKSLNNVFYVMVFYFVYLFIPLKNSWLQQLKNSCLQVILFIESTLHDVFVYKAGALTYFFLT